MFIANRVAPRSDGSDEPCVQSVASIDMGKSWSLIDAGALCNASSRCSLHAFGVTAQFGAVYSAAPAVGFWLAQGNVGECLAPTPAPDALTTFASDDAAATWRAVAAGQIT